MQVLLIILGLLLYLGIIYLWTKSTHMTSKWLLMLVLVILPSLMYYMIYLRSHQLTPGFLNKIKGMFLRPKKIEEPVCVSAMSVEDAYRILQLPFGANRQEVCDAHRRLMVRNHPDNGGSAYIAAMLNQAKATLVES